METPTKKPEISSMTREEEQEMQHDISKLQDQVQQTSLWLKGNEAKMNGMEANMNGMQVKMDGVEAKMNVMDAKMNGMDANMEELKINLNNLLQEMVTNGERVLKQTHDENKINVNHDFIVFLGKLVTLRDASPLGLEANLETIVKTIWISFLWEKIRERL